MKNFKLKHIIVPPIIISVVFFLLFIRLKGVSGGDILIGASTAILFVGMTLIIGLISYSWKMKEKVGYLIGIVTSLLLLSIYNTFLL